MQCCKSCESKFTVLHVIIYADDNNIIFFTQSLGYCKEYPVLNFSIALRLMSDGSLDTFQFVSEPEKSITIDNLSENTLYWFKILV